MELIEQSNKQDVRNARIQEIKSGVEARLQSLITTATALRKTMAESKTHVKKKYYERKFKRVNAEVLQLASMLEQFSALESHNTEPSNEIVHEDTQATATA